MTVEKIQPKVGEIWNLVSSSETWVKCLVIEVKSNGESFISAEITIGGLEEDYTGVNIEIWDSFSTKTSAPFVIHMDSPRKLKKEYFDNKQGKLSEEDWQKVANVYCTLDK